MSSKVSLAKRSSAEWIAESMGSALPDFSTVGFGAAFTAVSGTNDATDALNSGSISSFGSVEENGDEQLLGDSVRLRYSAARFH